MKMEHRAIIDNAKRHGALPMEMAHELLEHDLVQLCLDQLKGLTAPYNKLSETAQQDTIERITLGVKDAVKTAIRIIAANGVITIPVDVKRVQVDAAKLTVTATVDGKDPKKHDLIDSAGHLCLLVMAPDDYDEALDGIKPDRDQKELPLSAAELAAGMGLNPGHQPDDDIVDASFEPDQAPAEFVADEHDGSDDVGGGHSIDEITVMVLRKNTIDLGWLQSRFALDTDQANAVAIKLLDANVIVLETEGDTPYQNVYRVTVAPAAAEPIELE